MLYEEVNNEVLRKVILGQVKKKEYLEQVSSLCKKDGLLEVEIKYLGGLEVMIVDQNYDTVEKVVMSDDHSIRRWLKKV